jgi:endonuclease/exonuclease/phosphatase family metal-dependent hydrolase
MRLICLNTWGGKLYDQLYHFLERFQTKTDLFCFQEVFAPPRTSGFEKGDPERVFDLYERLGRQLRGFRGYLAEPYTSFGERLALFVRDSITINDHGEMALYRQREVAVDKKTFSVGSRLQWVVFRRKNKLYTIANIHGIWLPSGKEDTPERLVQSENIAEFLQHKKGAKILCGDFNLLPQTRSIKMLEQNLRNLIREYAITSTRSSHYSRKREKFADYIFTSADARVLDFRVLEDEVSDHLPLLLEFDSG